MKIDKIYRLVYVCEDSESCESPFFTDKKSALDYLEEMEEDIDKLYEEYDNCAHPFGGTIILQEMTLKDIEDVDAYAEKKYISEWVYDAEFTEEYQKNMANAGIQTEELFGMWKDI